MTIDGYKSCRKLRKQVLSTELNIRYINTKYSSLIPTVAVAQWIVYFSFDSYISGSCRFGRNLIFYKKADWKVTKMCLPFSRLNGENSSCVANNESYGALWGVCTKQGLIVLIRDITPPTNKINNIFTKEYIQKTNGMGGWQKKKPESDITLVILHFKTGIVAWDHC